MTGHYARAVNTDPRDKDLGSPQWIKYLPQYLNEKGYFCYHAGKWHIPDNDPIAAGFEHSYLTRGWDRHFTPAKHNLDRNPLPQPGPGEGYYSTVGITDFMVRFLKDHMEEHPEAPFFGYLAYISPHFPLHALQEDIDLFMDNYLVGWDTIRKRRYDSQVSSGILDCEPSPRMPDVLPGWNISEEEMHQHIGTGEVGGP